MIKQLMAARRFEGVNSFFNFNTRTFIWGIFLQSSAIHGLGVDKFDEIKYIMDHVNLDLARVSVAFLATQIEGHLKISAKIAKL